jgi:hypothetical protein
VLDGANGPTLPEADDVLQERGVLVVPDVFCNAGDVTVSYFEWVQDFSNFFWTEDEINARLDRSMVHALSAIWDTAGSASNHASNCRIRGGVRTHPVCAAGARALSLSGAGRRGPLLRLVTMLDPRLCQCLDRFAIATVAALST